ncbi:MAG: hypothetical protein ACLPX7_13180 [Xanthobacteraceae bacterium]
MLRKLIQAGAIVAFFVGSAAAQDTPGISLNPRKQLSPEQIEKQKAADQAYQAAMKKIPDKSSSGDPWGNVRPAVPTTAKNKQQ